MYAEVNMEEQQVEWQGIVRADCVFGKREEIIGIAKRDNNTKRNYLVVNKCQGKHVPIAPDLPLKMFSGLAEAVAKRYQEETLLLIGFAETATAIGETLAIQLGADYMQTTRERVEGVEFFYFSESHSHATEQKLVKDDLDAVIERIDRIVFVEDEVTTGNTIGSIVHLIQQAYEKKLRFSVASLLNGMDETAQERYREEQIDLIYLIKTDHSEYPQIAEKCSDDGVYYSKPTIMHSLLSSGSHGHPPVEVEDFHSGFSDLPGIEEFAVSGYINARRLHGGAAYQSACEKLWQEIAARISFGAGRNILVLGTEEFMYPPLFAAKKIQDLGNDVKFHATTRSPILVSRNPMYPLHERYELASLYEDGRTTYLYDLASYDAVLILTDANACLDNHPHQPESICQTSPGTCLENHFYQPESICQTSPSACLENHFHQPESICPMRARPGRGLGAASLCHALAQCGNEKIYLVRWCEDEKLLSGK